MVEFNPLTTVGHDVAQNSLSYKKCSQMVKSWFGFMALPIPGVLIVVHSHWMLMAPLLVTICCSDAVYFLNSLFEYDLNRCRRRPKCQISLLICSLRGCARFRRELWVEWLRLWRWFRLFYWQGWHSGQRRWAWMWYVRTVNCLEQRLYFTVNVEIRTWNGTGTVEEKRKMILGIVDEKRKSLGTNNHVMVPWILEGIGFKDNVIPSTVNYGQRFYFGQSRWWQRLSTGLKVSKKFFKIVFWAVEIGTDMVFMRKNVILIV